MDGEISFATAQACVMLTLLEDVQRPLNKGNFEEPDVNLVNDLLRAKIALEALRDMLSQQYVQVKVKVEADNDQ